MSIRRSTGALSHAIKKRLVLMERFKAFAKDSELTEDDAIELGKKACSNPTHR
jgi:hypothetical protein